MWSKTYPKSIILKKKHNKTEKQAQFQGVAVLLEVLL